MKEKYTEIFRLKEMLERENIPFEFEKTDEYIIRIPINKSIRKQDNKEPLMTVYQGEHTYGGSKNLLEICGGMTLEERKEQGEEYLGYLTAENVFERIKYCYLNQTSKYINRYEFEKAIKQRVPDLEQIIKVGTPEKQIIVAMEELSELIKELAKYMRGNGNEENLQEEVCDCIIMIDQLRLMFKLDAYDIDEIINMKIKRTLKRLGIK
jgi:hypothetical protein